MGIQVVIALDDGGVMVAVACNDGSGDDSNKSVMVVL